MKPLEHIELIEPIELIASKTQRPLQETLLKNTKPIELIEPTKPFKQIPAKVVFSHLKSS